MNKISLMTLSLIAVLANVSAATASDTGYRYNKRLGKCFNVQSLPGMNRNLEGECGDLWGSDLSNKNLAKKDFAGANLARVDLSGSDLSNANFSGANLMLARTKNATLSGAVFNERTILPFDRQEAIRRGMVFVSDSGQPKEDVKSISGRSNVVIKRN